MKIKQKFEKLLYLVNSLFEKIWLTTSVALIIHMLKINCTKVGGVNYYCAMCWHMMPWTLFSVCGNGDNVVNSIKLSKSIYGSDIIDGFVDCEWNWV